MSAIWLSYIPRYIVEDLLRRPDESLSGRELRFHAVALFADISGFTRMSEALGHSGRRGAEELTSIINSFFEPLIAHVESYGGMVGAFGGDALTALFPCAPHDAQTVLRAVQCALDMQQDAQQFAAVETSAGTFQLRVKVGLAHGPVFCCVVGDAATQITFAAAGTAINRCAEAEHHATSGEIVACSDLLSNVEGIVVTEQRGAWSVVAALDMAAPPAPLAPPTPLPSHMTEQLTSVVHPILAQRLQAGEDAFVNEHRNVSVLWVGFNDLDYDGDMATGAALQQYVCAALAIIYRYGGYLNRVDMGDKGSKLLALFGAPVMHQDDAVRAVRCALELRALHQQLGASVGQPRMGISTGFLFCGHVGAPDRQEYTVMGDAIILAVRLLQAAAPGQILISDATHDVLDEPFDLQPLAPIHVKGRSQPVELWHVNGEATQALTHMTERTTPLIGREQELATAQRVLDHTEHEHGQMLFITAEAGIGKSRLSAEIVRQAAERGFHALGGACQSYGTRSNYLVWHDVWRGFFDLDPRQPIQQQQRQIEERLGMVNPAVVAHAPLLGPVLNMALADNEATRSLDGQLRQNALHALLLQCLRAATDDGRRTTDDSRLAIVVLEDCHWIDPLSVELLEFLGRNVANLPIALVVIHRPIEDEQHAFMSMARMPYATTLDLHALTNAEAEQIVGVKLKQLFGIETVAQAAHATFGVDANPLHELVERVVARAEGNPFYIEELVNFIHDQGIDPHDRRAVQALTLPDSLHSLVLSRIDRLNDGEQRTLKVASVIGRTFAPRWLWSSYPALGTPQTVVQHLDTLSRLDLTPLDKPAPEPEYMFKHAITQEAAYESLSFAMRARLHERVGQFIEQSYADDIPSFVNVLAHHYERTRNRAKQRIYFRRAADAAKVVYANQTAIYYYEQLLPLLPEQERPGVLLDMGEVLQLIGKWSEAEAAYRQALTLAGQARNVLAEARSQDALGYLLSYTESYDEGLRWLTVARATFEEHGEQRGLGKTLEHLSFLHSQRSEYAAALRCAEQHRQIAEALGDQVGLSNAEANMGLAYQWLGEYAPSLEHLQRSIGIARRSNYQRGLVHASGDMAGVYWMQGDYYRAMEMLQEALQAAMSIGYLHAAGVIVGNMGILYERLGELENALLCYTQGLYIAVELENLTSLILNLGNIAHLHTLQMNYDMADTLFQHVLSIEEIVGDLKNTAMDLCRRAELLSLFQRYKDAQSINNKALSIARDAKNTEIIFDSELQAIALALKQEQIEPSIAYAQLRAMLNIWHGRENEPLFSMKYGESIIKIQMRENQP